MSQLLCQYSFPNWQEFSDWMATQKCLNPNLLDKYTSTLSDSIFEALVNGQLGNKPFDPYEYLYEAIEVLKDSERVILILSAVSFLLSREEKRSTTDEYYEKLNLWNRAWEIFSVYVKRVILPSCLDVLIDEELSSDYRCHDFEAYHEYNRMYTENDAMLTADAEKKIHEEEQRHRDKTEFRETHEWNLSYDSIDFIGDELMREHLRKFNDAQPYTNWLTPKEVVEKVLDFGDAFSDTAMADASVYNPDEALSDAANNLFISHKRMFERCETAYLVIFIGSNFPNKAKLFRSAQSILHNKFISIFSDEDVKIKVGIAHDSEKIGEGDLSLYAFCC